MRNTTKIAVAIVVILLLGLFFVLKDVRDVSVENIRMDSVTFSEDAFTVTGTLDIRNPSMLTLNAESIVYEARLRGTDTILASGDMPGFSLEPKAVTNVPFSLEVQWAPTLDLALTMIKEDHVYVDITGYVTVRTWFSTYDLPYATEIDIKEYAMQFVPEQAQGVVNSLLDIAKTFFT